MTDNLKASPPWAAMYRKIAALFEGDPDVSVAYDDGAKRVDLYVNGGDKADALARLLEPAHEFGKVRLAVEVHPANSEPTRADVLRRAFAGNAAVAEVVELDSPAAPDFTYVVFRPGVAQFFGDNLASPYGAETRLHEDIAREVACGMGGVMYSTAPRG